MKETIRSLLEFRRWVERSIVPILKTKENSKLIFLLKGPMGAGKTELVSSLARCFGFTEASSPTFALSHRYELQSFSIDHWDLFRLESEDDLESSGFWDQWSQKKYCVFIEWSERISVLNLPREAQIFEIQIELEGEIRKINLKKLELQL